MSSGTQGSLHFVEEVFNVAVRVTWLNSGQHAVPPREGEIQTNITMDPSEQDSLQIKHITPPTITIFLASLFAADGEYCSQFEPFLPFYNFVCQHFFRCWFPFRLFVTSLFYGWLLLILSDSPPVFPNSLGFFPPSAKSAIKCSSHTWGSLDIVYRFQSEPFGTPTENGALTEWPALVRWP